MNVSRHARDRIRQRGITEEELELIVAYGEARKRSGKATEYHANAEHICMLIKGLRNKINELRRIRGKSAVISEDGCVITVYKKASKGQGKVSQYVQGD